MKLRNTKFDPVSKTQVAIKKGYSNNQSTYGVSNTLIREFAILKELALYKHKNIVEVSYSILFDIQLIDVFPSDNYIFIVEKFYPSYIQQYLSEKETPFTEKQTKYIMYSTARALLFLKECKLIHGVIFK